MTPDACVLTKIDGGSAKSARKAMQIFEHREGRLDDGMEMMDALKTALLEEDVERRKDVLLAPSLIADGRLETGWLPSSHHCYGCEQNDENALNGRFCASRRERRSDGRTRHDLF